VVAWHWVTLSAGFVLMVVKLSRIRGRAFGEDSAIGSMDSMIRRPSLHHSLGQ
jgi:hypothetical protein